MMFGEYWTCLRGEAKGVKMDVLYKAGRLEMQWSFSDQGTKLKIVELLKQRAAKYQVCHTRVCFWIEVDPNGLLDLVKA